MAGVEKIIYKGKEILFINYNGCKNEIEMIAIIRKARDIVVSENKPYLQLSDITNAYATPGYMNEAKKIAREAPKIAIKRAIVGVNSLGKKIILKAYNQIIGKQNPVRPFDSLEEAKEYLVS